MNCKHFATKIFIAVLAVFSYACQQEEQVKPVSREVAVPKETGSKSYIVVYAHDKTNIKFNSKKFEDRNKTVRDYTKSFLSKYNIDARNITHTYGSALEGFAAILSDTEVAALKANPKVASIEPDQVVTLNVDIQESTKNINTKAQTIPWGIKRVGRGKGAGKTAWVIDSGIDLDHPDLNVDKSRSKSFVEGNSSANDGNGHGTHVAGIIAAKNNGRGVIGVAYGATVVPVKVLRDSNAQGKVSWMVAGIDYVAANASSKDVANISFLQFRNEALDNAVKALADKGVLVAIAAGNEKTITQYYSPSRVNHKNVVTVSAMHNGDYFAASYSNYGYEVDYAAPGTNILSSSIGGGTHLRTGTSMAAPHVAGLLLLKGSTNLNTDGTVIEDQDDRPDPIAVK